MRNCDGENPSPPPVSLGKSREPWGRNHNWKRFPTKKRVHHAAHALFSHFSTKKFWFLLSTLSLYTSSFSSVIILFNFHATTHRNHAAFSRARTFSPILPYASPLCFLTIFDHLRTYFPLPIPPETLHTLFPLLYSGDRLFYTLSPWSDTFPFTPICL